MLPQSLAGFKGGGRFAAEKEGLSEEGRRKGREGRGWRQREIGGEKGWREKGESRLCLLARIRAGVNAGSATELLQGQNRQVLGKLPVVVGLS